MAKDALEVQVDELRDHIQSQAGETEDMSDQLHVLQAGEARFEEVLEAQKDNFKSKLQDVAGRLTAAKKDADRLQKVNAQLRDNTAVASLEKQVADGKDTVEAQARDVGRLEASLQARQQELDLVATELLSYEEDFEEKRAEAVVHVQRRCDKLQRELAVEQDKTGLEREKHGETIQEKSMLQEELDEAEFWKREYEAEHGLTEAVAYQKKLKMDIKSRDRDLARLNGLLNDRIEAYEELYETKRRLLKQFNLPENFRYDDEELSEGMKGETERLKSVNEELERQIDSLEEERLKLLRALRLNARSMGTLNAAIDTTSAGAALDAPVTMGGHSAPGGVSVHALSAKQILQVTLFADNIREGRPDPLPLDDRSREMQVQVRDLEGKLAALRENLALADVDLESFRQGARMTGGGGGGGSPRRFAAGARGAPSPRNAASSSSLAVGDGGDPHTEMLREQLEYLQRENARLSSNLTKYADALSGGGGGAALAGIDLGGGGIGGGGVGGEGEGGKETRSTSMKKARNMAAATPALERKLESMMEAMDSKLHHQVM